MILSRFFLSQTNRLTGRIGDYCRSYDLTRRIPLYTVNGSRNSRNITSQKNSGMTTTLRLPGKKRNIRSLQHLVDHQDRITAANNLN